MFDLCLSDYLDFGLRDQIDATQKILSADYSFNTYSVVRTPKRKVKAVWVTSRHLWDGREIWMIPDQKTGVKVGITSDRLTAEFIWLFSNCSLSGDRLTKFCLWLNRRYVDNFDLSDCKLERSIADLVYGFVVKHVPELKSDRDKQEQLVRDAIAHLVKLSVSPVPTEKAVEVGKSRISDFKKSTLRMVAKTIRIPENGTKDSLIDDIVNAIVVMGVAA